MSPSQPLAFSTGREFIVRGRVQGVGFRAATQAEARQLGLLGSANNMSDGGVRVRAFGREKALETLAQWLTHGPRFALVDKLTQSVLAGAIHVADGFSVGTEG
jgi:acylphosphatase